MFHSPALPARDREKRRKRKQEIRSRTETAKGCADGGRGRGRLGGRSTGVGLSQQVFFVAQESMLRGLLHLPPPSSLASYIVASHPIFKKWTVGATDFSKASVPGGSRRRRRRPSHGSKPLHSQKHLSTPSFHRTPPPIRPFSRTCSHPHSASLSATPSCSAPSSATALLDGGEGDTTDSGPGTETESERNGAGASAWQAGPGGGRGVDATSSESAPHNSDNSDNSDECCAEQVH